MSTTLLERIFAGILSIFARKSSMNIKIARFYSLAV